jgi:hypothetical protein
MTDYAGLVHFLREKSHHALPWDLGKELLDQSADAIESLLKEDTTWQKHLSAEKPSELYFNEVTGIGNCNDLERINELTTMKS